MTEADDRHARQRLIPDWDQSRIRHAGAVVVGVGALGNEVAKNLALLGVGRVLLCDRDTVTASNLSRTVLFEPGDVGVAKVDAAARRLRRLAPDVEVEARAAELTTGVGTGELADAAVVLGCLDSRHARLSLLARCGDAGVPLVDGGTNPWGGEVRLRLGPGEPCYGCTLSAGQRAGNDDPAECGEGPQGASIITTSLVAGWMTVAAARLMLGRDVGWRFLEIAALTGHTRPVAVRRDPSCPFHRPAVAPEPLAVGPADPVRALLAALPPGAEPLARGMFAVPGSCYHCGGDYTIDAPAAATIDCPHCGRPVRPDLTQRIRAAPPDATLAAIGVAPGEFIPVREPSGGYRWLRLAS